MPRARNMKTKLNSNNIREANTTTLCTHTHTQVDVVRPPILHGVHNTGTYRKTNRVDGRDIQIEEL